MQQTIPDKGLLGVDARQTFDAFNRLLSSVHAGNLNTVPFAGSWTAAQTGDHVFKFLDGVANIKDLPAAATNRYCDDFVEPLRLMFLNFDIKMKAPQFVEPGNGPIDKDILIRKLHSVSGKVLHLIQEEDLALLCRGFDFPTIGEMTRLEWVYFGIYHVQRHTRQLENIIDHLSLEK